MACKFKKKKAASSHVKLHVSKPKSRTQPDYFPHQQIAEAKLPADLCTTPAVEEKKGAIAKQKEAFARVSQ